ncbi:MAG: recombination protein RecR [Candidatus Nealsonbacteria bacterium CG18_big_fil_WC_8_21_14_2_50_37_10]|uniref:Recombination protein RecR n=1 Tax=Candidatus Nealsonbacteria bacterium CG18_big_fil_WC_8_21_14_2_50_37_10 TaxID=1974717 RepID=A0A2H0FG52_9BACT|nr:MAG: recombination protein RecR [Candidatus Nealsonbacteria bacterium CG18_big_fil_WC_8_21_14_2_50_37_10]
MYSPTIQKLIDIFSKFPTVGPRTAARFVFYLLKKPKEEIENLISSINELKNNVKICKLCFNPFQGDGELCEICQKPSRDKSLLCLVEKETDLISIEKTKKYNGLYFILGGTVSALKRADIEKLRIKELEERIKNHPEIKEIILATNSTTEGQATALYLERLLKPLNKKITRLGRGLPVGAELEYADEETLGSALEGRK